MSLAMSRAEREAYLAAPHVAVLAVERPGHAPLAVPVWYGYEPGGEVIVWCFPGVKEGLIREVGRFTITVNNHEWPYRYVSVTGPVTGIEEPTPMDTAIALSVRYLGEQDGREFVAGYYATDQALIRMRPEQWLTVDYAKAE